MRLQWTWYASIVHALVLAVLAVRWATADDPRWGLIALAVAGALLVPVLGRATYRGDTLSSHLLLATVVVPPILGYFRGWDMTLPLLGLLLAVVYFLGVKGALGLRGRRGTRRSSSGRERGKGRPPKGKRGQKGRNKGGTGRS